jgi:hypothetical protein
VALYERAMVVLRDKYPGIPDDEVIVDALTKAARGP